jgi:hypothetical protein
MAQGRSIRLAATAMSLALGLSVVIPSLVGPDPVHAAEANSALFVDNIHNIGGYEETPSWVIDGETLHFVNYYRIWACTEWPENPECQGWIGFRFYARPPHENSSQTWEVHFAPPLGQDIAVGSYTNAVYPRDRSGTQSGMLIGPGGGGYCNPDGGAFTIHELEWTGDEVTTFAASFTQPCAWYEAGWGVVTGEVRVNSTLGYRGILTHPGTIDFGQAPTGTAAGARTVTITSAGSLPVHLGDAELTGADPASFSLTSDGCSGTTLQPGSSCQIGVSATPHRNRVLEARLRVPDDTARGNRVVTLTVEGLGQVDGMVAIEPGKLYPYPDDYFDELTVSGVRNEVAALDVVVRAQSDGTVVHRSGRPEAAGPVDWTWDGTLDGGDLVPAGDYTVVATLRAPAGNERIASRDIKLAHDWMEWKEQTITKRGEGFAFYKRPPGASISRSGSRYAGGVRISSGGRFAAVGYAFEAVKTRAYQWMTVTVRGRSPNRHKAVVAFHNPDLGLPGNLNHYDAARKIGPGYRAWTAGTQADGRPWNGKFRVTVTVSKDLGRPGPATFDLKSVRLTYTYGVLNAAPGASSIRVAPTARDDHHHGPEASTIKDLTGLSYLPPRVDKASELPSEVPAKTAEPTEEPQVPEPTEASPETAEPTEEPPETADGEATQGDGVA